MKSNTTSKGNFRLSDNLQHEVMHNKANRTDEQKSVVQIVLRSRSQGRGDQYQCQNLSRGRGNQCQCQIWVEAEATNVKSEARLVQLKSRRREPSWSEDPRPRWSIPRPRRPSCWDRDDQVKAKSWGWGNPCQGWGRPSWNEKPRLRRPMQRPRRPSWIEEGRSRLQLNIIDETWIYDQDFTRG